MVRRLQVITNSEVEVFRKCRALHGYQYIELLRPLVETATKGFGSLYHDGAAAGWRAAWSEQDLSVESRLERAIPAALKRAADGVARAQGELSLQQPEGLDELMAELEEHQKILFWALPNYFTTRKDDLRMVPLIIEGAFSVPVLNASGHPGVLGHDGVIDLALWDREQALIEIEDHKTSGYSVDVISKRLPLDTQLSGYLRALQQLRKIWGQAAPVAWTNTTPAAAELAERMRGELATAGLGPLVINFVRRAMPAQPKINLLKLPAKMAALHTPIAELFRQQQADNIPRGEVSVAQCDTTAEVYGDALVAQETERHQPITDKQRAFLENLRGKASAFCQRLEFYRGEIELERWRQEMWVEAAQIRASRKDPKLRTRNPHACAGPTSPKCVYAEVCMHPDSPEARANFRVAKESHEEVSQANGAVRHTESDEWSGGRGEQNTRLSPATFNDW